jgi:glycosyltransferase involved in cell wall biosynthesis
LSAYAGEAETMSGSAGAGMGGDGRVHVLFFISGMGGGGAEMHLLRVINHLDRGRFRISLALTRTGGSYEPYLAPDVRVHRLHRDPPNSSTLRMIKAIRPLRRLIKESEPDVVCSVMDYANVASIIASKGVARRPKHIISIQNPPQSLYSDSWHIVKRLMPLLIPRYYPSANRIVALSNGVAEEVARLSPGVKGATEVIYNAGVDERVLSRMHEPVDGVDLPESGGPLIVSCGRLIEQKGFSHLLDAMVRVREEAGASLLVVGEGPYRPRLERQVRQLGLEGCVRLIGFRDNPYKYMAAADVFVVSSLFEGFGNVIVEAMACGAPVVAADCPYGPGEIIEDGVSGILVEPASADSLARGILRVLGDEGLRLRLAANGRERSRDFGAEAIAKKYGELILRVARGGAPDVNGGANGSAKNAAKGVTP